MRALQTSRKEHPLKQSMEFGKSIVVCLNPRCPVSDRRYLRGLKLSDHSDLCKGHIFGIDALLETDESAIGEAYPVDDIGRNVNIKLQRCKQFNLESYADVLIEDFRRTVNKILDRFRETMQKAMPGDQLLKEYLKIFSLDNVKEILKGHGSSAELTTCLLDSHNSQNYKQLRQTNSRLDELNTQLNTMMEDMTTLLLGYEKDAIVVRRNLAERIYRPALGQNRLNEVCYGLLKSTYLKSEFISVDHNWIRFPQADPNHFKPWVYGEKGFSEGVHKLILQASTPEKNMNCGVCILQHQDLNSYPYAIYKSLHDRVSRQFKLIRGCQVNTFIDGKTQLEVIMDLNNYQVSIRDDEDRCLYVATLKSSVQYHFGLVGELWSVRIIHLT